MDVFLSHAKCRVCRRLVEAAKRRRYEIDAFYDRVFTRLDEKYPVSNGTVTVFPNDATR